MRLQRAFADGSQQLRGGTAAVLAKAVATSEMASVPPRRVYAAIEDSLKRMVLAQPPRFSKASRSRRPEMPTDGESAPQPDV